MITLSQKRPGEWFLFSDHIPEPFPVPSWIVEACVSTDRDILARELGKIYGFGRKVGKVEGAQKKLSEIRNALEIE